MKTILMLSTMLIATPALADSISITSQNYAGNAPLAGTPAPASTTGLFQQNIAGSFPSVSLSPYAFNTGPGSDGSAAADNAQYSVLNFGGSSSAATAIYNVNGADFLLVWGSPDIYNEVRFYSGANGTGSLINVTGGESTFYTGADLGCYATTCTQTRFDLLTFTDIGGLIGSIALTDTGTAAFEYTILADPVSNTPLPATLPMFAGGLGLFWWMRKRGNENRTVAG